MYKLDIQIVLNSLCNKTKDSYPSKYAGAAVLEEKAYVLANWRAHLSFAAWQALCDHFARVFEPAPPGGDLGVLAVEYHLRDEALVAA